MSNLFNRFMELENTPFHLWLGFIVLIVSAALFYSIGMISLSFSTPDVESSTQMIVNTENYYGNW